MNWEPRYTKLFRILALVVCVGFASVVQASECNAPCAGMPCCVREASTDDVASNATCCQFEERSQPPSTEPTKFAYTTANPRIELPQRLVRVRVQLAPQPLYQKRIFLGPIYLRNCVLRC